MFNPDDFEKSKDSLVCKTYQLESDTVLSFGKELTVFRERQALETQKAMDYENECLLEESDGQQDSVSLT